jgi:hypothetical protein
VGPIRKIINIKSKKLKKLIYLKFVAALMYPNTFMGRKDNLNLKFYLVIKKKLLP